MDNKNINPTNNVEDECNFVECENTPKSPLSPILNTSKSLNKIRRNKKHKRKSCDIFDAKDDLKTAGDESTTNAVEFSNKYDAVGNSSKDTLNIFSRIHELEKAEEQNQNVIKLLSTKATLLAENTKVHHDKKLVSQLDSISTDTDCTHLSMKDCVKSDQTKLDQPNLLIGFQTCTGKKIEMCKAKVQMHSKLFDDIFYNNVPHNKSKKFNYLQHKPAIEGNSRIDVDTPSINFGNIDQGVKYADSDDRSKRIHGVEKDSLKNSLIEDNNRSNFRSPLKNTFHDEDFSDLQECTLESLNPILPLHVKKSGSSRQLFKINCENTLSVPSGSCSINKAAINKSSKNIFPGENFDDLKTSDFQGFKVASSSLTTLEDTYKVTWGKDNIHQHKDENSKYVCDDKNYMNAENSVLNHVNIFKDENFDGLGIRNFNKVNNKSATSETISINKTVVNKSSKNIFGGENFDDLKTNNFEGFKVASSRLAAFEDTYKVGLGKDNIYQHRDENSKYLSAHKNLTNGENSVSIHVNIFNSENFDDLGISNIEGFKTATTSLKQAQITDNCNKETKPIHPNQNIKAATHFPERRSNFRNIFEGENFDDLNMNLANIHNVARSVSHFKPANIEKGENAYEAFEGNKVNNVVHLSRTSKLHSNKKPFTCPYKLKNSSTTIEVKEDQKQFLGFYNTEQDISEKISESYCDIINIISNKFNNIKRTRSKKSLLNTKNIENLAKVVRLKSDELLSKAGVKVRSDINNKRKFSELEADQYNPVSEKNIVGTPINNNSKRSRRRLGCNFSPTILIDQSEYKRAQHIFDDILSKPTTSTPMKQNESSYKPIACDLTPIQNSKLALRREYMSESNLSDSCQTVLKDQTLVNEFNSNTRYNLNRPTNGDVSVWIESLLSERKALEEKLEVIKEKENLLNSQKYEIQQSQVKKRNNVKPGILYSSKLNKPRKLSLKDVIGNEWIEEMDGSLINQINPQNAHLVHFVLDKRISHQRTQDGAIIVSNTDNRVGFSEIEHSFKILEGVDPNLIPNGWIKNHFKWIVWKLASYERTCKKFEGCLNLENIIQQLKYRYDVEIDRVKRSALRKIFEKDDCPKKTMVLCVSKIVKNNDTYELELTDGWYPIRTVIDKPLSDQVVKNKIRLGVKLITSGAELANCEGCFPLEAPDTTFLKINYNSTRRAIWWAQLGYQKNATPFPIPISSINFEGGRVGCVRCTIFRVYPVTYLEKNNNRHVRRNQRAEELCDHNFESNRLKEIEKINNRQQNSSRNNLSVQINNKLLKDIRNIKEPHVLYEICKNAEAEDLQDLSTEQKDLLNDYVKKKVAVEQHEALKQMNAIHKLIPNRSTTAVLKIKMLDTSCTSNKSYDLHIWNPQESHFLELKEGNLITIYNVSCSSKWGLTTSHSTQFLREPKMENNTYTPFERKVTRIKDLQKFQSLLSNFNEFDTVGLPIMKTVNNSQELWIADSDKNLLRVKIFEPPDKILLLDKVEVGRPISLCNLTFESICDKYAYAIGDFHTTVSRYPQSKYLQDELNELENILKTMDLKSIVEICKSRICNIIGPTTEKLNSDIDEMACSQMTATDFVLLQCVDNLI